MIKAVKNIVRQHEGKLTSALRLANGGHGLGRLPEARVPDATTTMVCGFCSTGCGLNVHLKDQRAVGMTPATEYPVNLGMACPKGWEALEVLKADDRATQPYLRKPSGKLEPVDWDRAMRTFVDEFKSIQAKHGPDSLAFISTGQIPTEEMAFLGSLAKFGMGIRHGDGNTRQCMATSVVAYKQAFGFDAPPYTYADFEASDVLVFIGANPCIAHPIMWERVLRNPNDPRIVVIDPRKTETAIAASNHLPINPKSDLTLLYAMARELIGQGLVDEEFVRSHTHDFDLFAAHLETFTLERAEEVSGIPADEIRRIAEMIGRGERVSFWWTMGVNQSYEGVRVAQAIINIALMTGNIGQPGTGANSITGQCNAMGSRLFSNTTNLLGGRDFTHESDRQTVADILNIDARRIPDQNGWAYDQIIEGIALDKIKGLWIIATNTVHSWINQKHARAMLDKLDFLVVQDMYHSTETAAQADLVLPAAGWGEKEGTFINSERRIGPLKRVAAPPGQAMADFHIFKLVAHYWGCDELFSEWNDPADVFESLRELSRNQPCDFTGIGGYEMLDQNGGIQWPYRSESGDDAQERRLFEDGRFYHADGKARFCFDQPKPMPEPPDMKYPLVLLTGRGTASQWHTQTRTGKSAILRKLYPQSIYVEINHADGERFEIEHGKTIIVESRRHRIRAKSFLTNTVRPGQIFIPMHYETVNRLTRADFDPYSRQPSYKACAVAIRNVHYTDVDEEE